MAAAAILDFTKMLITFARIELFGYNFNRVVVVKPFNNAIDNRNCLHID
jgi:hypothetical protein